MNKDILEKEIREVWFKDHIATFKDEGSLKTLTWCKPNTSIYYCKFIIDYNTLIVHGDLGEAVFCWSGNINWEFLVSLNLGYYASKCCASEYGRGYKEWDSGEAMIYLNEYFAEDDRKEEKEKFLDLEGYSYILSCEEWIAFLTDNGSEIFGDDYFELGNIGETICGRCEAYLIGIKMALEQTKANGTVSPTV